MSLKFENYKFSFIKNGKPVFVSTEACEKLGQDLHRRVLKAFKFDDFVYHFKDGSHVVAMHRHRPNKYFCKIDLSKFFYTVRRNRVQRALADIGLNRAEHFSKMSTIKNPYPEGGYVLPYGFIQSPILATLVLLKSPVGIFLRGLDPSIIVSVYMDDICLSAMDEGKLWSAFDGLKQAIADAGFRLNEEKTREPCTDIEIFNCRIKQGATEVLPARVNKFYQEPRTGNGIASFKAYCDIVKSHTWRLGAARKAKRKAQLVRLRMAKKAVKLAPGTP